MAPPPLTIQLFGPLRVTVCGAPMPRVRTRSVEWLLALLTLRHGRAVNRAWLAGTLWPQSSGRQALENLRADLVRLRKALGPESGRLQAPTRDALTIDLAGAAVDVLQFDAAIAAGDEASLQRAAAVYTAPLLEDCLEEWAFSERTTRAEQLLTALEALAERAAARDDHGEAIRHLRRAEALDPLRDTLPRRLMASLAAVGDPAAAIQTYRDFRLRLQEELAAAPDEATTRLFHEIRAAARHQAVQRRLVPTRSSEPETGDLGLPHPVPEPLPRPLTSLIGREQEMAQIQEALQPGALVTLVGGGGVGKTRLALEVARQADDQFPGTVGWVELGPLAAGALLLPSVAAALGLRDEGGAGEAEALTQRLVARLAEGARLLVLDNCEHLLDAAAALVGLLLQRCPALCILATSRQRLGLSGEVVWRVPSLSVPGVQVFRCSGVQEDLSRTPEHLMQYAAVRLFVERAAAVHPGFRLTSGTEAAAVGLICHRLDGIPLAIELAAARARVLTPGQIAARLDDRFRLLTGGARGALPRHQTLRALIDWSYDSLPAEEATLLRRLSVFAGGWTLEAAEAIGSDCGDVLDLLDGLVDRSLVLVDAVAGGLRYRMLETVREYAREKLDASGELAAVRNQHRDWYLRLAEQAEAAASASERTAGLTRLEAELDNLRAALTWCQEAADADPVSNAAVTGLRLAMALGIFWYTRGHLQEGLQWLEGALARGHAVPAEMRAMAYLKTAPLALHCGHRDRSQSLVRQARQAQEQVLAQARAAGDPDEIAQAVLILAEMAVEMEDLDSAGPLGQEARERMATLGNREGLARAMRIVGEAAIAGGDTVTGRRVFEERLAVSRQLDESTFLVHALGALGHVARDDGDYALARSLYGESLALRRKHNHRIAIAQSLEDLAALARREQQPAQAIRLLGAAAALCETLDAQPPVALRREYECTLSEGRAALGEAAFAAAWAEGRAMSLDQAVEYALG